MLRLGQNEAGDTQDFERELRAEYCVPPTHQNADYFFN